MKTTLGDKVTTNFCIVHAETGRFPPHIYIIVCIINYRSKILNSDVNILIPVAYKETL